MGLLGVLKDAGGAGVIDLAVTFERLRAVVFWVAPSWLQRLVEEEKDPKRLLMAA
ncbi:hypothetical protein [Kamptonema formosum]|uniref:hypothetical protein n=1 Tax=Kamptonema formosum TaxID=331992 RepID=UPI0003458108|nr:hypothetical protein [Oscillatoria sp. PCC 10802]